MSEIKQIKIDRHDSNKYQATSTSGADTFARVYYKDDGSLDEKLTYNKHYYEELHPKEEKVTKEDEAETPCSEIENDKEEGCLWKLLFTVIPLLPLWWIIKCPISWITYPLRKVMEYSNSLGETILPNYCFSANNGIFTKIIGTITLTLPLWWIIKFILYLVTYMPRAIMNIFDIRNARFWPRYSFKRF